MDESTALMEPMLPRLKMRNLEDLVLELVRQSSSLASQVHPDIISAVGNLVRSMNCYYSNLIEGHNTHPWDIEMALTEDYSKEPEKRNLQLEAVAHIHVQKKIDEGEDIPEYPLSLKYITWLHKEFCTNLPQELLYAENPDTGKKAKVIPGTFRKHTVKVGYHIPPFPANLPRFMERFEEAYNPKYLNKAQRIVAAAAAHHRLLWIHPFLDGNGRVSRLMSYSVLMKENIGGILWSAARGLARNVGEYKRFLMEADEPRLGNLDGRGTLSEKNLLNFCTFFLETCLDQIKYMSSLLRLNVFLNRMEKFTEEEIRQKRLPKGSFTVLREAFLMGKLERSRIQSITGYKERSAREIISSLIKRRLLVSSHHKDSLRLGFPLDAVEQWFPGLYPELNLKQFMV